jgi:hypothetical protein
LDEEPEMMAEKFFGLEGKDRVDFQKRWTL